jgi:hypothetical protein
MLSRADDWPVTLRQEVTPLQAGSLGTPSLYTETWVCIVLLPAKLELR